MDFPLELSQYKFGNIIGRGSTSEVYAATCLKNNRKVAIKVVDLEICPIKIETLLAEVAFWSNCKHRNVVEYYGSFVEGSSLYILMEYMSGGSCYQIMKSHFHHGLESEIQIATILHEVLKSLSYMHEKKQIHRDIKAGNILLNDRGDVKITDFGISANLLEQGHRKKYRFTIIGTPCYMAPEAVAAGIGYTEKADIWSLGITAIELATGAAPYSNLLPLEVIVRISNSPPPTLPSDPHHKFSSAFKEFVKMCLQTAPSKRPAASQLLESKFIKTMTSTPSVLQSFIASLPPIEERFQMTHKKKIKKGEKNKKTEIFDWDFDDNDPKSTPAQIPVENLSSKEHEEEVKPIQKGKFTITKHASLPIDANNEEKTRLMEKEVEALKLRIETLTSQNSKLQSMIHVLEDEINELEASN